VATRLEEQANRLVDVFRHSGDHGREGSACYLDLIAFLHSWIDSDGKLPVLQDLWQNANSFFKGHQSLSEDKLRALLELHRNIFEPPPLPNPNRDLGHVPQFVPPNESIGVITSEQLMNKNHAEEVHHLNYQHHPHHRLVAGESLSGVLTNESTPVMTPATSSRAMTPPMIQLSQTLTSTNINDKNQQYSKSFSSSSSSDQVPTLASNIANYGGSMLHLFNSQEPSQDPGNLSVGVAPFISRSGLNTPVLANSPRPQKDIRKASTPQTSTSAARKKTLEENLSKSVDMLQISNSVSFISQSNPQQQSAGINDSNIHHPQNEKELMSKSLPMISVTSKDSNNKNIMPFQNNKKKYDILYLPMDFKKGCNGGYAFLNFIYTRFIK
jgi:hypothetical protein